MDEVEGFDTDSDGGVKLTAYRRGNAAVIALSGELDFAAVGVIVTCIESALDESVELCILDCKKVTFIDSDVLRVVLSVASRFERLEKRFQFCYCAYSMFEIPDGVDSSQACKCSSSDE
ncbi:MAG: STAS domain-containing protein [Armatimonadota bacterium]